MPTKSVSLQTVRKKFIYGITIRTNWSKLKSDLSNRAAVDFGVGCGLIRSSGALAQDSVLVLAYVCSFILWANTHTKLKTGVNALDLVLVLGTVEDLDLVMVLNLVLVLTLQLRT